MIFLLTVLTLFKCENVFGAQPRIIDNKIDISNESFLVGGYSENLPAVVMYSQSEKQPPLEFSDNNQLNKFSNLTELSNEQDSEEEQNIDEKEFIIVVTDKIKLENEKNGTISENDDELIHLEGKGQSFPNKASSQSHQDAGNERAEEIEVEAETEQDHNDEAELAGNYEDNHENNKEFIKESDHFVGSKNGQEEEKDIKFDEEGDSDSGYKTSGTQNYEKKDDYVKTIEYFDESDDDEDFDADLSNENLEDYDEVNFEDEDVGIGHYENKEEKINNEEENVDYESVDNSQKHRSGKEVKQNINNKLQHKAELNPY